MTVSIYVALVQVFIGVLVDAFVDAFVESLAVLYLLFSRVYTMLIQAPLNVGKTLLSEP